MLRNPAALTGRLGHRPANVEPRALLRQVTIVTRFASVAINDEVELLIPDSSARAWPPETRALSPCWRREVVPEPVDALEYVAVLLLGLLE